MFFFSKSASAQARVQADNLLQLAAKVDSYRRDVVPAGKLAAMHEASDRLLTLWQNKASSAEAINAACEELHLSMLPCGGDIYPVTMAGEYSEMLMAAAILTIGVRAFFLQPFKIPTNSMYPTYNGMTPYVYSLDSAGPSALHEAWNLVKEGATHYDVRAPADGEVLLPLNERDMTAVNVPRSVRDISRLWLIPVDDVEYTMFVGQNAANVLLPADFGRGFDEAFYRTYFPDLVKQAWVDPTRFYQLLAQGGHLSRDRQGNLFVSTGRQVHKGDPILSFDLRTGDMLFVDRFSYNFIAPKPGDPFVFHTGGIPELSSTQGDQYYIKRLVGVPGDTLEVRPPVLYRNGAPNTGAAAFDKNARQEGNYPGYTNGNPGQSKYLLPGDTFTVPEGFYFAMGDNSPSSYDSRYWRGVPTQNVVGRAVMIIYPFTFRWGLAQ